MDMGVLGRRVDQLLKAVESGKVHFKRGNPVLEELASDLAKVTRHPSGDIDLETCTPLVRQMSRTFRLASRTLTEIDPAAPPEPLENSTPKEVEEAQRRDNRRGGG